MMDYVAMGERIRFRRRALRLTQEALAERAGITASFLGHVERGTRIASIETLMCLCRALGATPNELLGAEMLALSSELPERVTLCASGFLQGVAEMLRRNSVHEF